MILALGFQEGKPLVLNVVRKAEDQLVADRFVWLHCSYKYLMK